MENRKVLDLLDRISTKPGNVIYSFLMIDLIVNGAFFQILLGSLVTIDGLENSLWHPRWLPIHAAYNLFYIKTGVTSFMLKRELCSSRNPVSVFTNMKQ